MLTEGRRDETENRNTRSPRDRCVDFPVFLKFWRLSSWVVGTGSQKRSLDYGNHRPFGVNSVNPLELGDSQIPKFESKLVISRSDLKKPAGTYYSLLSASPWTVVLSIALATADNFADPDLWIHMLTGQTTLRTGRIPRFDSYSYSAAGMPWHNHEWLSQVALAFCYAHLGIFGLKLLKVVVTSIVIIALGIGISATNASGRVQRLTLIFSAVALTFQMEFRPQLFTFMMMSIVMSSIAIEVYRGSVTLWWLIPIFALWANFHGGYIVGLGAMSIATTVLFLQEFGGTCDRRSAWRLGVVTLGCAAATILNPFGVGLWTGVAHSVRDPLIHQIVNDWVPLPKLMLSTWAIPSRKYCSMFFPCYCLADLSPRLRLLVILRMPHWW